jgi:hypothetical protein
VNGLSPDEEYIRRVVGLSTSMVLFPFMINFEVVSKPNSFSQAEVAVTNSSSPRKLLGHLSGEVQERKYENGEGRETERAVAR